MAKQSLAIKYRPKKFEDVCEQGSVITILKYQLESHTTQNAYLFCGGAGTGKTTCARIFANELNGGVGNPIELDAASNNSVDDVRGIIQRAKTASIDSEYKVFILDEVHALSNNAWQALLKILEEPPAKTVFIMCTTDPQKIPKTILSRVQRYDFQRISQRGIVDRLKYILRWEDEEVFQAGGPDGVYTDNCSEVALEFIAKLAEGGMRDAITLLDKCLAYSSILSVENIEAALGTVDFSTMFRLTNSLLGRDTEDVMQVIEGIHYSGKDLKQFIKSYMAFVLDLNKYDIAGDMGQLTIPSVYEIDVKAVATANHAGPRLSHLLRTLVKLNADIKWDTAPKANIQATLFLESEVIENG